MKTYRQSHDESNPLCSMCLQRQATISCSDCGITQPINFCYNCDSITHSFSYKSLHNRKMLNTHSQANHSRDSSEEYFLFCNLLQG